MPAIISYLQVEQQEETLIVTPLRNVGSFAEIEIHDEWLDLLSRVDQPNIKHVVLDFGSIGYFGSIMLEFIVQLAKRVKAKGGRLAICNGTSVVKEIFTISRFDKLYPIVASRDEALKAVAG
jgi:anti-anti-sigma factor